MAEVTAQMVKELRQKTGSGIALCKEALVESNGDFAEAEMYLRKKDKDKAAKKAERATGEGVVFVKVADDGKTGVIVEIACETDFVAKNEKFQKMGDEFLDAALCADSIAGMPGLQTASGKTVEAALEEAVATIGENMKLRRVVRLTGEALGAYRHFNNKAASLVAFSGTTADAASELGRDVCMHITSCRPMGLNKNDIPADIVAREKEVFAEEVKDKPAEIQDKILDGKLGKFYATNCLEEQGFVKDESVKVKDHVAKTIGGAAITGFARVELGSTASCVNGELVDFTEG